MVHASLVEPLLETSFSKQFTRVTRDQGTWHANDSLKSEVMGCLLEAEGPVHFRPKVSIVLHSFHISHFPTARPVQEEL